MVVMLQGLIITHLVSRLCMIQNAGTLGVEDVVEQTQSCRCESIIVGGQLPQLESQGRNWKNSGSHAVVWVTLGHMLWQLGAYTLAIGGMCLVNWGHMLSSWGCMPYNNRGLFPTVKVRPSNN